MKYYGFLSLVLACLMASVFVQGKGLFNSSFFLVAYLTMSAVLVVGSKYQECFVVDVLLGLLLTFAVGFLSTEVIVKILTGRTSELMLFQMMIVISLDYCALGFLRRGREMKHMEGLRKDDRYGIY